MAAEAWYKCCGCNDDVTGARAREVGGGCCMVG
jgi:hypothetical protein